MKVSFIFLACVMEFTLAKPGEAGDVLVIPKAVNHMRQCHDELFQVLRDPALFQKPATDAN